MKKIITILTMLISISGFAQTYDWKDLNSKIDEAKNTNNEKALIGLQQGVERAVASKNADEKFGLYYQAYITYNILNSVMNDEDKLEKYIDSGIKILETLNSKYPKFSDGEALAAAFYGRKIGLSPMIYGMKYGSKAGELTENSTEHGAENPRAFLLEGIGQIYKPAMFGGGMDKAEENIKKALGLFDSGKGKAEIMWGHPDCYIWLGVIAKESGKKEEARKYFNKALELSPGNGWVTRVLLPELDK